MEIIGSISESFDPSDVPVGETSVERPLRVKLGHVKRLNSTGVREWLMFVRSLPAGTFVLEDCAVPFVQQLGMIFNMAPAAAVLSIQLPFFCAKCNKATIVTVATRSARGVASTPERCPQCDSDMEFDELPEAYLGWIDAIAL